jgi:Zn-dependent peptidase ImmA (M78 family)
VRSSSSPTKAEAEALASDTRVLLDVGPEGPLTELAEKAAALGLLVFSWDLGTDSADAATVLLRSGGVAIINGERRVGRRRLALAHEIGHYLVADEYTVDWRVAEQQDVAQREGLLDYFARALLLPKVSIASDWGTLFEEGRDLRTAAIRLGSSYRVDMATLARRLRELGLIDHSAAGEMRRFRTTRADILNLYRSETISASRAIDLLFDTWDEESLPALPRRAEGEIWQYV